MAKGYWEVAGSKIKVSDMADIEPKLEFDFAGLDMADADILRRVAEKIAA